MENVAHNPNSALPPGWRWVKLTDTLLSLETGTRPKGGAIGVNNGVPSISAEQMTSSGEFDISVMRFVPEDFYYSMIRGHIKLDDILVVKDGATTGKVCLVRTDFPFNKAVINEHVFLCRPNQAIVFPSFLFFWLWGPVGQQAIRACYQGAAIGGINQRFANMVVVPLPPLAEQKRIAAILKEQMAAAEKARAAAMAQLEAAKALPAVYLRQVFPKEGQELSPGWRWVTLGSVCDVVNGFGFPEHLQGRKDLPYPFIKVSDMNAPGAEVVVSSAVNTVDRGILDSLGARIYPSRTIIFPKVGGALLTNKKRLLGKDSCFDNNVMGLVPRDADADFLFCWFQTVDLRTLCNVQALPSIKQSRIAALRFPMPAYTEQKRIAAVLNEQMASAERLRNDIEKQLHEINALPAALLRRAFMGEL